MSAVPQTRPDHTPPRPTPGIAITRSTSGQTDLLPPAAMALLVSLHREVEPARQAQLQARRQRQQFFDDGGLPDFREDTRAIREGDWQVAPTPSALQDRRVEITGPVDPKMVINALNSGAKVFMADFEDSTSPTWHNLLGGQRALIGAVAGDLQFTGPAKSGQPGKHYALKPFEEQAVLLVRPRGWHLDEKHVLIDGCPIAGGLFDVAVFAFHNARALMHKDRGPYFYLPKLQSMEEATLWETALAHIEAALGLPHGQMKVTVLIETLPAAFEMHEILYVLRDRVVGLNCGRWDYIFSYLKTFRNHPDRILSERGQVTMTQPFLQSYSELLIQTCHQRGAHAMGGMAAQIPISNDESGNEQAMARVRADKLREVTAGHDGTWVAHPALITIAREIFDEHMRRPNQKNVLREDVLVTRDDLIRPSTGTITRAGFEGNVEVCVRYLAAWLDGNGCVPINWLMEDAATAEISRTQLWQWLHARDTHLTDGTAIDFNLLASTLQVLPGKLGDVDRLPGGEKFDEAIALLDELSRSDELVEFLTLPAYQRID